MRALKLHVEEIEENTRTDLLQFKSDILTRFAALDRNAASRHNRLLMWLLTGAVTIIGVLLAALFAVLNSGAAT